MKKNPDAKTQLCKFQNTRDKAKLPKDSRKKKKIVIYKELEIIILLDFSKASLEARR